MTLTIANNRTDSLAVCLAGVTPCALADKSLDAVRRTMISHGNERVELGECFAVSGDAADRSWRLVGDFSAACQLGACMTEGRIVIEGGVGPLCGWQLRGGEIDVRGDAGESLGAEMRGGVIRVGGNCGSNVGGALPGSPRGMAGGAILVAGSAGAGAGRRMRRGLIAVAGDAAERLGERMLAGTIVVAGRAAEFPGVGMRRGTIALAGKAPPTAWPTFRPACRGRFTALGLVAAELKRLNFRPELGAGLGGEMQLWHGDLLESGRGEVFTTASG
jgi:formylmethanofuran dehydrogenase subunit C